MGFKPESRRAAFLWAACADYGYCGSPAGGRLTESDLEHLDTSDAVVDAVLAAEGLDDIDRHARRQLTELADDWLFAPTGRGHRSGLPR